MSSKRKSGSSRGTRSKAKDYVYDDEEEAFSSNFNLNEKLCADKFAKYFVQEMKGEDVNLEHFQRNGFTTPLYIPEKSGLTTVPLSEILQTTSGTIWSLINASYL